MFPRPRISILLATYNRSSVLRQTLRAFASVRQICRFAEIIVVDNNSNDQTPDVVESAEEDLPVRYMFEPRAGKNCALNRALNEAHLGDLVVFTDDDVVPNVDWLEAIVDASARWPNESVFGGRIYALWPEGGPPSWAKGRNVQSVCFSVHDHGENEIIYHDGTAPFGPNFWVRRDVLANGPTIQ